MASKKKTQKIIGSSAAEKAVNIAVSSLVDMATSTNNAIIILDKQNKKLAAEAKRLGKKRIMLMKRKKTAANKLKKDASAINKKDLKTVDNEIAATKKEAARITSQKTSVSVELTALKAVSKRAAAYNKAMGMMDRVLNKPKKKAKKKKSAKRTLAPVAKLAIVA